MLKCNGKTFMNLQEAVQWLLNNNALIFICTEDYAADTEIPLSALANPSPANPKIGSVVMFADGKISPINGLTDDSFTVGAEYIEPQIADIPLLETIVDKDGHSRFIEGSVDASNLIAVIGEENLKYARWSLSGTHLMVVLAFVVPEDTTIPPTLPLGYLTIPSWIYDKVQRIIDTSAVIDLTEVITRPSSLKSIAELDKESNNTLGIYLTSNFITTTEPQGFRIQFDMIIDNQ